MSDGVQVFIFWYIVTYITGGVIVKQSVLDAKKAIVDEIATKFNESASAVVVEYRGLTVAEVTELRRLLRAEEVDFKVYKNSMAVRAAEVAKLEGLNESLKGPNAIAFGKDAVAPARVLAKFAKKHDALVIKSGVVEGEVVDVETINKLSKLPNKEGMISMFLGCLQSPVIKFACAVKAVKEAKEDGTFKVVEAADAAQAEAVNEEAAEA